MCGVGVMVRGWGKGYLRLGNYKEKFLSLIASTCEIRGGGGVYHQAGCFPILLALLSSVILGLLGRGGGWWAKGRPQVVGRGRANFGAVLAVMLRWIV